MSTSLTVLMLYIIVLAPAMLIGFIFARRKMFAPAHKFTMTGITIANWVLILAWMAGSYNYAVLQEFPESLNQFKNIIASIHLITGGIAQLLATDLVILMWTERTALERLVPFRIKKIKTPMRLTLALWLTTIVLGIGIYFTFYASTSADTGSGTPESTEIAPESTEAAEDEESPEPDVTEESGS